MLTRKFGANPRDVAIILDQVVWPYCSVAPPRDTYLKALELIDRLSLSFYDALIVAAAMEAKCDTLYTEDLQAGQKIEGLTIVNPFAN